MGKKNQRWQQRAGRQPRGGAAGGRDDDEDGGDSLPSAAYDPDSPVEEQEQGETGGEEEGGRGEDERVGGEEWSSTMAPSKFQLYQQSVQSPKGDISYMQKFFLMYVGGRMPLHLQEDFCGTALISAEWIRSDPRRTAIGTDLDLGALNWCLRNNLNKIGADGYSRISLFHGNVLCPEDALHVKPCLYDLVKEVTIGDQEGKLVSVNAAFESNSIVQNAYTEMLRKKDFPVPPCDIVCAFNYSCCCLHKRADLLLYFKHALDALSKRGGIFVMDLYGGSSSECKLKLRRRFPGFTYIWEQQVFDIVTRTTRISLHFQMGNKQMLRHAFSYHWRLWSLPEIKDCLEEAGFESVHFWLREMPDTGESKSFEQYNAGKDVRYEEITTFQQTDAWNAYIVGVAHRPRP